MGAASSTATQAPTGMRAITELLWALERRGGGVGLFTGCAAGDTAGAVVVEVDDRQVTGAARNTSRTCPACGHISAENRCRAVYRCLRCPT